jgi:fructose-1,6-bisphosphatase class II
MITQQIENLVLEASKKAAIESYKFIGKGDSNAADQAAVEAMRSVLKNQDIISATVVIGEGERDVAPMLFIGEELGSGSIKMEIAVDPLEGTSLCANNQRNSITAIAIGNGILHAPDLYMEKIASVSGSEEVLDLDKTIEENIRDLSELLDKKISEITVVMLDRPRHQEYIDRIRKTGAKVSLISDGDLSAVMRSAIGDGVHLYFGIGGAPEGVLAACALKTLGGFMQARLISGTKEVNERSSSMGVDFKKKYHINDMVKGDVIFGITGITDGDFCNGVQMSENEVITHSIILNSKNKTQKTIEEISFVD